MGTLAVHRQRKEGCSFALSLQLCWALLPVRLTQVVSHFTVGDDKVFRLIYRQSEEIARERLPAIAQRKRLVRGRCAVPSRAALPGLLRT